MSPEQVLAQYVTQAYRTLNPVVPSHGVFGSESPDVELPRLAKAYNRENGSYLFQNSVSVILSGRRYLPRRSHNRGRPLRFGR